MCPYLTSTNASASGMLIRESRYLTGPIAPVTTISSQSGQLLNFGGVSCWGRTLVPIKVVTLKQAADVCHFQSVIRGEPCVPQPVVEEFLVEIEEQKQKVSHR